MDMNAFGKFFREDVEANKATVRSANIHVE
jgi:hypothetical protein